MNWLLDFLMNMGAPLVISTCATISAAKMLRPKQFKDLDAQLNDTDGQLSLVPPVGSLSEPNPQRLNTPPEIQIIVE